MSEEDYVSTGRYEKTLAELYESEAVIKTLWEALEWVANGAEYWDVHTITHKCKQTLEKLKDNMTLSRALQAQGGSAETDANTAGTGGALSSGAPAR